MTDLGKASDLESRIRELDEPGLEPCPVGGDAVPVEPEVDPEPLIPGTDPDPIGNRPGPPLPARDDATSRIP